MAPLDFAHFNHFIPGDSSQGINDLDRILSVSQITLHTKFLHRQSLFWYPEALLQLRYMEYVMYISQIGW
jgi:hypothetical protein